METAVKYQSRTPQEQLSMDSLVADLVKLYLRARKDGLLSLQTEIADHENSFLRVLFGMVVDRIDPAYIESYGRIRIATSNIQGIKLVEALAILESALSIYNEEDPELFNIRLSTFVSMDDKLPIDHETPNRFYSTPAGNPEQQLATIEGIKENYQDQLRLTNEQLDFLATRVASADPTFLDNNPDLMAIAALCLEESTRTAWIVSLPPRRSAELLLYLCKPKEASTQDYKPFFNSPYFYTDVNETCNALPRGDPGSAAKILSAIPPTAAHGIAEQLIEQDADLAELILKPLVVFDDIALLDDGTIRQILAKVYPSICICAVNGASEDLRQLLYAALPPGTIQRLEFFRQNLTMDSDVIDKAQNAVLSVMRSYPVTSLVMSRLADTKKERKKHDQP
jgi:hypothetical protein